MDAAKPHPSRRRLITVTVLAVVAQTTAAAGSSRAPESSDTVLVVRGGTLIDGTGRTPRVGVVVAQSGRIVCAGEEAECPVPPGARVLDATSRFVLPGLMDTHVHLYWQTDSAGSRQVETLRFALGLTTVREAGTVGQLKGNLGRRALASRGERAEPRLVVAGLLEVEGPALVDQVRQLAAMGVAAIKVKYEFPPDELIDAAAEAHRHGLPVFGHVIVGDPPSFGPPRAPEAYDGVSHLQSIAPAAILDPSVLRPQPGPSEDITSQRAWYKGLWLAADSVALAKRIDALLERGSWLEPLLVTEEWVMSRPRLDSGQVDFTHFGPVRRRLQDPEIHLNRPSESPRLDSALSRARAFVLAFERAGGMLVAGTDNAPVPGFSLHQELGALVRAGLSPAEALAAATRNAASALGVSDSLGTLEAGKLADLIVIDGDPLADIRNTERVWRVVKGGVVHDPAPLLATLRAEGRASSPTARRRSTWMRRAVAAGAGVLAIGLALGLALSWRRRNDAG